MKYAVIVSQAWDMDWEGIPQVSVIETDDDPREMLDRYRMTSGLEVVGMIPIMEGATVYIENVEAYPNLKFDAKTISELPRFEEAYDWCRQPAGVAGP